MLKQESVPIPNYHDDNIVLRPATHVDKDTLLLFEQEVIATERHFDDTLKPGEITYYDIDSMIDLPHIELLVAESQGRIIASGYIRIENAKPYLQHRQFGYLGFMYVVPDHRGRGINKLIINALQQWAKGHGITEFRLEVYNDNLPAVKAYEKIGFKGLLLTMRKGI